MTKVDEAVKRLERPAWRTEGSLRMASVRLDDLETIVSVLKVRTEALSFYRDNWDWFPGDGEQPNAVDVGSPPTFYEAEPNAALSRDWGKRAETALTDEASHEG